MPYLQACNIIFFISLYLARSTFVTKNGAENEFHKTLKAKIWIVNEQWVSLLLVNLHELLSEWIFSVMSVVVFKYFDQFRQQFFNTGIYFLIFVGMA